MPEPCVICAYYHQDPQRTSNLIGLRTAVRAIVDRASRTVAGGAAPHILAPVCPEHVIDIYRGRVPGVAMAWRASA